MPHTDNDEQERKLFIGGLNKDITDEDSVKDFFKPYGTIVDVTIMRDQQKISRGFGFILFDRYDAVDKIMRSKKSGEAFTLDGHDIEIKRALPKSGDSRSGGSRAGGAINRKIFVGGLASTTTENDMSDYFEQFGYVTEVELLRDRDTNRLRGFAFVTFEDEDSADKCVQRRQHIISKKTCEVKRAQVRANIHKDDNRDHHARNDSAPPPMNAPAAASGMMDMATVNQLIAEAHMQGLKQGLQQAATAFNPNASLLAGLGAGAGLGAFGGANASVAPSPLLQAIMGQSGLGGAQAPAPPPAPPVAEGGINPNLAALLLQNGSLDASTLQALGLAKADTRSTDPRPPASSVSASYSTAYPPPTAYDMYQTTPSYGSAKEEEHKRYRPY